MTLQKTDEVLADHAGTAENADVDRFHCCDNLSTSCE
jgi:hypothetical protein